MQGTCQDLSDDNSYQMMDKLIKPNHILRQIKSKIDFSFVDTETELLFSPNRGRKSIPPQQYFKMLLIKHLFGIPSNRKLIDSIQYNICYRWFCGFTMEEKIPDQSIFTKLKKRFGAMIFESFFNAILIQCVNKGLVNSKSLMADSTLFCANAALNSMERIDKEKENKLKRKLSNKTHQSTTDPDCALAFKTGTPRSLKYKAHVCTDSNSRVITHIRITSGAVHDSALLIEQIKDLKKIDINIMEAIADSAYGSGEVLTELHKMNIQTNIPLFSSRSGSSKRTDIPGFTFNIEENYYVCSEKKIIPPCDKKDGSYTIYLSKSLDCKSCLNSTLCQAPLKNGGPRRILIRNQYYDLFEEVKEKMATDNFKQKLYQRMCKIEGVMNELKNFHGLNRAHYRGLENVSIQGYMAAIAINIKRIISFWFQIFAVRMILI